MYHLFFYVFLLEPLPDRTSFDPWENDDRYFVSTRASKEVETITKKQNLVIVTGPSGSGKSAIIQHIALQYRKQDWTVKPVKKVEEIVNAFSEKVMLESKLLFVFNDPIGKESFDEMLFNLWQIDEEKLTYYLKSATCKLLISCRKYVLFDIRVKGLLNDKSCIFDINSNKNRLNEDEKRNILNKHTSAMDLSQEQCDEMIKNEDYFPLLCKLFSSKAEYKNEEVRFFREPIVVLKEEINAFKKKDKITYCGLFLLVLFNNDLRVENLVKNDTSKNKFKKALDHCGLPESTAPFDIGDNLESHTGFFTKKIGNSYQFYHDLVMEVTTQVLGSDFPTFIIQYADIGFLRRRVKLGTHENQNDSFTIYLDDAHVRELAERFFADIFGERFLEVVLNPCLINKTIVEVLKHKLEDQEKLQILVEKRKVKIDKQELNQTSKTLHFSELAFVHLENEVSVLFALILFHHTDLSLYCLEKLQKQQANSIDSSLFLAVCCNGSEDLFNFFLNRKELLNEKWGCLFPIHILTVFHHSKMLEKLINETDVDVDLKTETENQRNPLVMPTRMDNVKVFEDTRGKSGQKQSDKKELLLSNKTHIVSCLIDKVSSLYIACFGGHYSIVQVLLSKGADIDLCKKNGESPLYIACKNGHDATVTLLLEKGADVNLCMEDGTSPLTAACFDGHDSTVKILVLKGADVNLCDNEGFSPLHVACQNEHNSTVQLLLSEKANINLCKNNGPSPVYVACKNGHFETVKILLEYDADINLCIKDGTSPLIVACLYGYDAIVELLLTKGANINSSDSDGYSPLYAACQNGHDSTIRILLSKGADVNLCTNNGASPLFKACGNCLKSTVQLLLEHGADINKRHNAGFSPLYYACQKGNDSTIKLLLELGADINSRINARISPLYIAFRNRHYSTVNLLLNNNADTSLVCGWKANLDSVDCFEKNDRTVEFLLRQDNIKNNMYDPDSYFSLFVSCHVERETRWINGFGHGTLSRVGAFSLLSVIFDYYIFYCFNANLCFQSSPG